MKHCIASKSQKCRKLIVVAAILLSSQILISMAFSPTSEKGMLFSSARNRHVTANSGDFADIAERWENIWGIDSVHVIRNLTKTISEVYPSRIWHQENMTPSTNLVDAWSWANDTLFNITGNGLVFRQVTEYQHLIAVKNGTNESTRPTFLITGVIDSGSNPGANDMGASVAAVLQMASVLSNFTFPFDIYYVLVNGYHSNLDYDPGSREFVSWLDEKDVHTINALNFDRLLFDHPQYLFASKIALRSSSVNSIYQDIEWIPDMMLSQASSYGNGRLIEVPNVGPADVSFAQEMWRVGRPAVHVSQGYWPDSSSGTEEDVWNDVDYGYEKTAETVASASAVLCYMGALGEGENPVFHRNETLSGGEILETDVFITITGYLNVTISCNTSCSIRASIEDIDGEQTVYQRTENDGLIKLRYRSSSKGFYAVEVENLDTNTTNCQINTTLRNDCDGDGIADAEESQKGTEIFLRDSDFDGLDDQLEISIGSNPCLSDTDGDGASDSQEYEWGSSLTANDTDEDGLSDGLEGMLGTDPTKEDTDADGLHDFEEVNTYNTNPTKEDSDGDGLGDGFEVSYGLNPLSQDTDGDGLTDLFEIINQIDPLSVDSDNDGWGDAYEVESCMSPTNSDTDGDGIPDGVDWDPRSHWIVIVSPVSVVTITVLVGVFGMLKHRAYSRD